ncbi:MAG TPA: hypothetical protein VLB69_07130 [Rudaea sp.]|nr:hypothetical protein [Rudaea sp.]
MLIGAAIPQFACADEPVTAIVVQDAAPLRAAAKDSAQQQAVLWQGDTLEVRGRRLDYLQVYDHRRERAGFVRAAQVRVLSLRPQDAPELLAVVRFLRDTTGAEALGIGYVAAYLKAAPANAIGAEPFDALGTMADRLARRASTNRNKANDAALAAHLEVVAGYGVSIRSLEHDGRMQLCYDGDAFRRVLALESTDEEKARAALALTRQECIDPAVTPVERARLDQWRADVLDRAPRVNLPEYLKNRLRMRSASVWASIAFERTRHDESAHEAANLAMRELAAVDKLELTDEDLAAYNDAAMRVGASRWGAEPEPTPSPAGLAIATTPGQTGETCIKLLDRKRDLAHPLLRRCTFGTVWTNSARTNPYGTALALAVQPLESWREMWVFHLAGDGWRVDVVPPGDDAPDQPSLNLGYIEFAGWVPGGRQMLAAREVRSAGRFARSFEVLDLDTLAVQKRVDNPRALSLFYRWQDPAWKGQTVSLR